MTSQLPPAVSELCRKVSEEQHAEVYHAELNGRVLSVQIEVTGGTSLDACARFSRALSAELDAADALPGRYVLEVSSPGVERRLYCPADFARVVGAVVRIRTSQRTWESRLLAADDSSIKLVGTEDNRPRAVSIMYGEITEARVVVRDDELFRSRPGPATRSPVGPEVAATESADWQKGNQ